MIADEVWTPDEWTQRWDAVLGLFLEMPRPRGGWVKHLPPEYYKADVENLTCIREQLLGAHWEPSSDSP